MPPSDHIRTFGWVRVHGAFEAEAAARMGEVIWRGLIAQGMLRDKPSTWTKTQPEHVQHLKSDERTIDRGAL